MGGPNCLLIDAYGVFKEFFGGQCSDPGRPSIGHCIMRCLFTPKNLIFRSIFITFGCNIQIVVTCLPYYFVSKVQLTAYRRLLNDPVRRPHKRAADCADDVVVRRAKRLFHIVCRRKWDCIAPPCRCYVKSITKCFVFNSSYSQGLSKQDLPEEG